MFDELFLMSFRSSNGSGMGAAGATSGMLRKVAPQPPDRRSRLARGGPCRQGAGEGEGGTFRPSITIFAELMGV